MACFRAIYLERTITDHCGYNTIFVWIRSVFSQFSVVGDPARTDKFLQAGSSLFIEIIFSWNGCSCWKKGLSSSLEKKSTGPTVTSVVHICSRWFEYDENKVSRRRAAHSRAWGRQRLYRLMDWISLRIPWNYWTRKRDERSLEIENRCVRLRGAADPFLHKTLKSNGLHFTSEVRAREANSWIWHYIEYSHSIKQGKDQACRTKRGSQTMRAGWHKVRSGPRNSHQ